MCFLIGMQKEAKSLHVINNEEDDDYERPSLFLREGLASGIHPPSIIEKGKKYKPTQSPKHCFLVQQQVYGLHSTQRIEHTYSWWKTISLQSIINSKKHLTTKKRNTEITVDVLVYVGGNYSRSPSFFIDTVSDEIGYHCCGEGTKSCKELSISLVKDRGCETMSVRVDIDDGLLSDTLTYLFDHTVSKIRNGGVDVVMIGSKLSAAILLEKRVGNTDTMNKVTDDGSLLPNMFCSQDVSFAKYTMSLAQTITIKTEKWLEFSPGRLSFGNHVKIHKTIKSEIYPKLKTEVVMLEDRALGMYLVTELSGHFNMLKKRNGRKHKQCSLETLASFVGNQDATLLWDNRDEIVVIADKKEKKENVFWDRLHRTLRYVIDR